MIERGPEFNNEIIFEQIRTLLESIKDETARAQILRRLNQSEFQKTIIEPREKLRLAEQKWNDAINFALANREADILSDPEKIDKLFLGIDNVSSFGNNEDTAQLIETIVKELPQLRKIIQNRYPGYINDSNY